jgi:hypothetical protein
MSPAAAVTIAAIEPADLPNDPALLKAMLTEVLAALRASRQEGDQLRQRLDQLLRRLRRARVRGEPPCPGPLALSYGIRAGEDPNRCAGKRALRVVKSCGAPRGRL